MNMRRQTLTEMQFPSYQLHHGQKQQATTNLLTLVLRKVVSDGEHSILFMPRYPFSPAGAFQSAALAVQE
jgi:hypothetical protein